MTVVSPKLASFSHYKGFHCLMAFVRNDKQRKQVFKKAVLFQTVTYISTFSCCSWHNYFATLFLIHCRAIQRWDREQNTVPNSRSSHADLKLRVSKLEVNNKICNCLRLLSSLIQLFLYSGKTQYESSHGTLWKAFLKGIPSEHALCASYRRLTNNSCNDSTQKGSKGWFLITDSLFGL